jgi:hypothetical protein
MRIGSVTMDNYQDLMRLFDSAKQGRLGDIKQRVRTESGNWDFTLSLWSQVQGPIGRGMTNAEFDAQLAAMNPNHIKGLVMGSDTPPGRTIALPDHMVQGIKDLARLQYAQIFNGVSERRMQHGDELGMLERSFVRELPKRDRLDAMFTMNQIFQNERQLIESAVRQAIPNWQRGMRVPEEIKAAILSGNGGFDATV